MPARQPSDCLVCRETVETNEAAITITMMIRTAGVPGDNGSPESGQGYICADCGTAFALGKVPPPSQPLTLLAHSLISRKVAKSPNILIMAWQRLRKALELPPMQIQIAPALPEGEVIPPPRRALAG